MSTTRLVMMMSGAASSMAMCSWDRKWERPFVGSSCLPQKCRQTGRRQPFFVDANYARCSLWFVWFNLVDDQQHEPRQKLMIDGKEDGISTVKQAQCVKLLTAN